MRSRALVGLHHSLLARDVIRNRLSARLPYRFEPLTSPGKIRLLEVHPAERDDDEIRCSLRLFDLREAPRFNALSYTWGYPLTRFSNISTASSGFRQLELLRRQNQDATARSSALLHGDAFRHQPSAGPEVLIHDSRCFPISCDGRAMTVTPNLYDALHMLRARRGLDVASPSPRYVWIDAICVDQANIAERNAQVAMMADIFRASEGVLVWLGAEDQFTADAVTAISSLSQMTRDAWDGTTYTDFFDPAWPEAAGIAPLNHFHWLGFLSFINRPWFNRAWVVQELALARSAVVVCGSASFPWERLDRVLAFVRDKRWYHHLSTEKMRYIAEVQRDPGVYAEFLRSNTSFRIHVLALARTRKFISMREQYQTRASSSLERLMQVHRETDATDPRDKVYAFLGLASRPTYSPLSSSEGGKGDGGAALEEPDYKLPVQEVYTRVTTSLLLSHGDLRVLSNVQDATRTKTPGLPSWVPDFSAHLAPYPLSIRGPVHWSASQGLRWQPDAAAMKQGLLRVRGFLAGTIEETAAMPEEAPNSAAYWASIVRLALGLADQYPLHCQPPADAEGTEGAENAKSGGVARHDRRQTRMEALWRTLITDTYARLHPAPESCGSFFIDYVLNLQIRHTLAPWSAAGGGDNGCSSFQPHQPPPGSAAPPPPAWHELLAAEPADSPYGTALYRERMATVVESVFRGTYSPLRLAQLQHELDVAGGSMRRVFRTGGASGLLGTGPRSVRTGDEVWVLAGGNVPFVLRRSTTGAGLGRGTHRLVGEAYVHGLMHRHEGAADVVVDEAGLVDVILE